MMVVYAKPGALQRTLDTLPAGDEPVEVRLEAGTYREKCTLSRAHVTLCGAGAEKTRIVWDDGAVTILPDGMKRGTFRTATLMVDAPHVTLRHLTVQNGAAPREAVGQAVALYADGDGFTCEDCRLLSFQDTLFTAPLPTREIEKNGFIGPKQFAPRVPQRHTYRRCLIAGDVDFIFGGAAAWFEDCELRSVDGRSDRTAPYVGYVTAASTPEGQAYGYVFSRCRFTHEGLPAGSVYLGRPWRNYAQTLLVDCWLGEHIHPDGFHDWNKRDAHGTIAYAECRSHGPGAGKSRAPFVRLTDGADVRYEAFMASL